ncbi:MAG: TetR/AcrR family transcriptional regulator [Candidatus Hydrogenedentes bacterium]|nr:TetR/AcrR family transcriptional regulator [Candidatus Hydrogenedentota bacterium]
MINKKSRQVKQTAQRKLLRAAADAFAAQGYDAASTRAIADRAGVNIALIAYHFGGKDGLFDAVIEDWVLPLREAIDRELAGLNGAGKRMDAVVTAFLRHALIVAPGVASLIARESIMASPTAITKRTAVGLRPLIEQLDAVLPTCETTVVQGAEFLALLLRLAAPMPSIDGDGAKNYHRARLRALAVLRHGGGHTQHLHRTERGEDTPRKHAAAPAESTAHEVGEALRGPRARHTQSPDQSHEAPRTAKETHGTRHTPPESGMDFVD